jgi:hypothetical protein
LKGSPLGLGQSTSEIQTTEIRVILQDSLPKT